MKKVTGGVLAAFALVITVNAQGQTSGTLPPPRLGCSLLADDAPAQALGRPIQVSNLKRIRVRATLFGPQGLLDGMRIIKRGAVPAPAERPTLEIVATRISGQSRTRVGTQIVSTGTAIEPNQQYLDFSMEIPIDGVARRQKIESYLGRLDQESQKARQADEFRRLTRDREAAIAAFERLYVENVVGEFEVACRYSARRAGFWNGQVESSPPIRLQVVSDGNFFDQPAFVVPGK